MRVADIPLFLVGNRGAIERIAGSWWSLLVGALLVVTAGIARNYDHLDLLRNPEWVWGPFAASFISSVLVFGVVSPYLRLWKVREEGTGYLSFMCIYWMTAPCAWLYAIPVEAVTDLVTATKWNIAFLAVVSVWRVVLVTRALVVLTGAGLGTCLVAVLFPASAVMCVGSFAKGVSLVGIMGGVRLPPHTELLQDAADVTMVLSFVACVFLLLWMIVSKFDWGRRKFAERPLPWRRERVPRGSLVLALAVLMTGFGAVVPVQVKVQRNHRLEMLILNGDYGGAIDYASGFQREEFSAIHYLPPDPFGYPWGNRREYQALLGAFDGSEAEWLRELWMDQYVESLLAARHGMLSEEQVALLKRFPEIVERIESAESGDVRDAILGQWAEIGKDLEE